MTLRIYRSAGFLSRSIIGATLVAEVETDQWPNDEAAFADEYGGDIIEEAPVNLNPGEDHEYVRYDGQRQTTILRQGHGDPRHGGRQAPP